MTRNQAQATKERATGDGTSVDDVMDRLSHPDVRLVRRFDGPVMVRTECTFPDNDNYVIHVLRSGSGLQLSDRGCTLMHISFDYDVDALMTGSPMRQVDNILAETGVRWGEHGTLCIDSDVGQLANAVRRLEETISRIYDVGTTLPSFPVDDY